EAHGGPLHHVDRGLVLGDVMSEPRRAEHQVVAQFVGLGELCVVVGADRPTGKVGGDVDQADGHGATHLIQAGVTGSPFRCRYSAMALRFLSSSRWPAPNMSQKSPTQTGR